MNAVYKTMQSPVGQLTLIATDKGLAAILWENDAPARVRVKASLKKNNHPVLREAEQQLKAYFAGKRKTFTLDLDFDGTAFHAIPFGETRTYAQIAKSIGRPKAVRAVGAANGRNPISIVAPCHRVIGSNGSLTGFAGGLKAKETLLRLEGFRPT
jgi:methylated-DNA-[protein]-cysteine S-methyltransferase